jgi:hypothetical protein
MAQERNDLRRGLLFLGEGESAVHTVAEKFTGVLQTRDKALGIIF